MKDKTPKIDSFTEKENKVSTYIRFNKLLRYVKEQDNTEDKNYVNILLSSHGKMLESYIEAFECCEFPTLKSIFDVRSRKTMLRNARAKRDKAK